MNITGRIVNLNDQRCVESQIADAKWTLTPCGGDERNYFVCEVPKIYGSSSSSGGNGGRTAGIVIGVLIGIAALVALGIFITRRMNLKVPEMPSFDNPLSRNQRNGTGIKPQNFENSSTNND